MDEGRSRVRVFVALIAIIFGILSLRLGKLQLIEASDHTGESKANAMRERRVQPPRGRFFDRNGVLMVENEPSFTLFVTPSYFDETTIPLLADLLFVADSTIENQYQAAKAWSSFKRSPLRADVSFEALSRVLEQRHNLPGVDYEITQKRHYLTDARMTHAMGYVREISESVLKARQDEGYRRGDPYGQGGLELQYESDIRGQPGSDFKMVNVRGQVVEDYLGGREDRPAVNGLDLDLTIDADLQAFAESLFVGRRGGVIAVDPNNGEVLAMHSAPDYDLSMFTSRLDPEVWDSLRTHPDRPLFNRVTQSVLAPGSTFKPLIALLALEQGVIDRDDEVFCDGGHPMGHGDFFTCLAEHGSVNVVEAIMHSCNTFFFEMARRVDVNSLNRMASLFGFGKKPYLDIAASQIEEGLVPDSAYFNALGEDVGGWTQGWVMNLGVGQGQLQVSTLQLVRYVSAIANGGTLHDLRLVRSMTDPETGEVSYPETNTSTQLEVNPVYFDVVKEGMRRVVREKSSWLEIPGITSIGKTGSAQNNRTGLDENEDDSWFIIAAPAENPQIAIAVLVENAGYGSTTAGPIGSFMAERYLRGHLEMNGTRRSLMQRLFTSNVPDAITTTDTTN